jgi:hypothetical protein
MSSVAYAITTLTALLIDRKSTNTQTASERIANVLHSSKFVEIEMSLSFPWLSEHLLPG